MPDEYDTLKPTLLSLVEKVVPHHHRESAKLMLETEAFFETIRDQCKTSDVVKKFVFSADKRKWSESPEEEEEMRRFVRHYNYQFSTCLGCKDPYLISMQEMCKEVEDLNMMDFFAWLVSQDRSLSAFCRMFISGVASRFCKEKKFVLPCPGVKVVTPDPEEEDSFFSVYESVSIVRHAPVSKTIQSGDSAPTKQFHQTLQSERIRARMSLGSLSQASGVRVEDLVDFETGRRVPSPRTKEKIEGVF